MVENTSGSKERLSCTAETQSHQPEKLQAVFKYFHITRCN